MAHDYETQSTSLRSSKVSQKVLRQTERTRLVARAEIIDNPTNPEAGVKINLIHQIQTAEGTWEDIAAESLATLKAGEGYRLHLNSASTLELHKILTELYAIHSETGVPMGHKHLTVGEADEIVRVHKDRAELINALVERGYPREVWEALVKADPDLATALARSRVHAERVKTLSEFAAKLEDSTVLESWWQDFFDRHQWIFGYGLNYVVLRSVTDQPHYGGTNLLGEGAQRGDFLTATQADKKFTVLVEIKKPSTPLLRANRYRAHAWPASDELAGGISQTQTDCRRWEVEGSRSDQSREILDAAGILTVQPKGILVIGNLKQLDEQDKHISFQLLRRNLVIPEVITFDELYERARFIIEHNQDHSHKR